MSASVRNVGATTGRQIGMGRVSWQPVAAVVLVCVLFFETRALTAVAIVATTPATVLGMAEAGLVADANLLRDVLYVVPKVEKESIRASIRHALGRPADGRLLLVRASATQMAALIGQLDRLGIPVRDNAARAY